MNTREYDRVLLSSFCSQLQRMAAGMTFVTISFCLAGLVQIKIDVSDCM